MSLPERPMLEILPTRAVHVDLVSPDDPDLRPYLDAYRALLTAKSSNGWRG